MPPRFVRPRTTGTVTVRRHVPPQTETTAPIAKGELTEALDTVARRIGLRPVDGEERPDDALAIVDAQGLTLMARMVDGGIYYMAGGACNAEATAGCATADADTRPHASRVIRTAALLPPDVAVSWAFDPRMLLHAPHAHNSPETPHRLQRALEMLQQGDRAAEILPRELLNMTLSPIQGERGEAAAAAADAREVHADAKATFIAPRLATMEEIASFQDPAVYTAFIETGKALDNLKSDVYCNEGTSSVAVKLSVAAVIDAGEAVLRAVAAARHHHQQHQHHPPPPPPQQDAPPSSALLSLCLVRPPGHHCTAGAPSGFCLVNNVAIAARRLLDQRAVLDGGASAQPRHPRVAIIDLDVHFGEGTVSFVDGLRWPPTATTPSPTHTTSSESSSTSAFPLLYLSLHRYDHQAFYPFDARGASDYIGAQHPGSVANVAVHTHASDPAACEQVISDHALARVMDRVFLPRLATFQPDVVYVSLGFDAAYGDPLGRMAVEGGYARAMAALKRWCLHEAPNRPVGLITVLEGGYNPESVAKGIYAVAHALTFPPGDATVQALSATAVPRTWADLRQRQARRHREWVQLQREGEQRVEPANKTGPAQVPDDAQLLERHGQWCDAMVAKVGRIHAEALASRGQI